MSVEERAWLGAFIEADGSATAYGPVGQLTINQKEINPIATALRISGCGHISLIRKDASWRWAVPAIEDVIAIAQQCAPYSWKLQRLIASWGDDDAEIAFV